MQATAGGAIEHRGLPIKIWQSLRIESGERYELAARNAVPGKLTLIHHQSFATTCPFVSFERGEFRPFGPAEQAFQHNTFPFEGAGAGAEFSVSALAEAGAQ